MLYTTNTLVHFLNHTYIYIYFIIEIIFYLNAVFMIFTQSNMGRSTHHLAFREHAKKAIYNIILKPFVFQRKIYHISRN